MRERIIAIWFIAGVLAIVAFWIQAIWNRFIDDILPFLQVLLMPFWLSYVLVFLVYLWYLYRRYIYYSSLF